MITKLDDAVENVALPDRMQRLPAGTSEAVPGLAATPFLIMSRGAFHSG